MPHKRVKWHIQFYTDKFHIQGRTAPQGELRFFYLVKIMRTMIKQNEHDDPSLETAVFLIKSSYNAAALIDSRRKQKSR